MSLPMSLPMSLKELEAELCQLAAHIACAEYRWLMLLAEFDRRLGWADWGMKGCAHWLSWKCGLDLRTARDKVRVAHALTDLPRISEAFSRGEISYSKVRAMTRIATPGTEADLLMFARHGTTNQVEKLVRSYRRCVTTKDANDRHDLRYVECRYASDGSVVIKARLDPEEGELVTQAIDKLGQEHRAARRAGDEQRLDGSAEPRRDRADALVEMARRELAGERSSSSSADRYTVMVHVDASVMAGGDGQCQLEQGPALSAETVKRLVCDGSLVTVVHDGDGEILNVGRKTRTIPSSIRRALHVRDGGCVFPGCPNTAFVDGHHIVHFADGGPTSLSNLASLCTFHHRTVHEGTVTMRIAQDGRFTFINKVGDVIETAALSVEPGGVERMNADRGLKVDGNTIVPRWDGKGCDYSVMIEGLARKNKVGRYAKRDDETNAMSLVGTGSYDEP